MGRRWKALGVLGFALAAGGVGRPAGAQFFTNSTGLADPAVTITFSEVAVAPGTAVTNQFSGFGATFTNLFMTPAPFNANNEPNITFPDLSNFDSRVVIFNPVTISFSAPVSSAAFSIIANQQPTTFEALLGGSVVASGSAPTETFVGKFIGFTGLSFDAIRFTPAGGVARIDNVQIGTASVPEPPPISALLLGCLGGLAFVRARRRRVR
jgi:hypothetical protein